MPKANSTSTAPDNQGTQVPRKGRRGHARDAGATQGTRTGFEQDGIESQVRAGHVQCLLRDALPQQRTTHRANIRTGQQGSCGGRRAPCLCIPNTAHFLRKGECKPLRRCRGDRDLQMRLCLPLVWCSRVRARPQRTPRPHGPGRQQAQHAPIVGVGEMAGLSLDEDNAAVQDRAQSRVRRVAAPISDRPVPARDTWAGAQQVRRGDMAAGGVRAHSTAAT